MTQDKDTPLLTREQALDANDELLERVEVPEWGGAVMVKGLMGDERDEFEIAATIRRRGPGGKITQDPRTRRVRELLVVRVVVDATRRRLFSETDVEALAKKSAAALERIFVVGCRLSGLSNADITELEDDQEKNS